MLSVEPIRAYDDNYIWLVSTNEGSIVIDPGESNKIIDLMKKNKINLEGILITHHHFDHTNGLQDLIDKKKLDVYGPNNNINGINKIVCESDDFNIIGIDFEVIEMPGHTLDHIGFYAFNDGNPILFCGDTLFAGGCGRIFEGTFKQMHEALNKISKLPKNTKIYCGHEYTLSNLKFALEVEPNNKKLKDEYANVEKLVSSNKPSLPSTLEKELNINPFLRCHIPIVQKKINEKFNIIGTELDIFTAIRKWKDTF
jgi:hydroxyacylglutathione hydrolase